MAQHGAKGPYLTTGDAARLVGVSRFTLLRAVRRGEITPAQRTPGGYLRFDPADGAAYALRLTSTRQDGAGRHATITRRADGVPNGRDSEERLRLAYGAMACGVLVVSAQGTLIAANEAAAQVLGLSQEQMTVDVLARAFATVTGEDGAVLPVAAHPSSAALRTGCAQRGAIMGITRLDGQHLWLQVDATPVLGDDGAPLEVVTSFIDVTARKEAEEALRASEQRKAAILATALDAIITVDHTGRITEFNPAAEAIFGYSRDEAIGQEVSRLIVPPARRERHDMGREQYLRTGDSPAIGQRIEGLAVRCDGSEFPVEVATLRLRGTDPPVFVGYIRDITARRQAEDALRRQALHDALTGLPNRVLLSDRLRQAVLAVQRDGQPLALMLLDLDRFKDVNDTLGHQAGDLLLCQVAQRLRGVLRAADTVARLGGDEFAVLLPGAELAGAAQAAQSILAVLSEPITIEDQRLTIAASIGIALAPDHSADDQTLLRYADIAMYVAKRAGGGYAIYSAERDQHSRRRLALTMGADPPEPHDPITAA